MKMGKELVFFLTIPFLGRNQSIITQPISKAMFTEKPEAAAYISSTVYIFLYDNRQPHPSLPEVTAPIAVLPFISVKKGNEEKVNVTLNFY